MYKIIEQLEDDHQKISVFIDQFEQRILTFMEDNTFKKSTYEDAIIFVRNFADQAHHQREEEILFRYMITYGGKAAETLVRQGMLVEHDYARFYIKELEDALHRYEASHATIDKLSILANGKAYCDLLRRHITKENETVYPFAIRILTSEMFIEMDKENEIFSKTLEKSNSYDIV